PRGGPDEAAQDVEERGLARAVRSDETARPLIERQAHGVQRGDAAVADGQAVDFDHGTRSGVSGSGAGWLFRWRLPGRRRTSRRQSRARSLGTWSARPAGAVVSTW